MINRLLKATLAGLAIIIGIGAGIFTSNEAKASSDYTSTKGWNVYSPETMTVTGGALTVKAYSSEDNKSAWIYNIEINEKMPVNNLVIPESVNGKTVTRIGWIYVPKKSENTDEEYDEDEDEIEFNSTLFGSIVEQAHGCDGNTIGSSKIESMTIPSTVTILQPSTFSGMHSLKSISIPDGVECLPYELFYGCSSLKKVNLPASLKELSPGAFSDCYKISKMTISSANKNFKIDNKCVITKKNKKLVLCYGSGNTFKIPKGTKILGSCSFDVCTAKTVHIPASVNKIKSVAFSIGTEFSKRYVQNVTIDKKNKVYARDGQTIYNKKDHSLSISIITGKKYSTSEFRMSNKVHILNDKQNYVFPNKTLYGINKVYISKNLKTVVIGYTGWGIANKSKNLYFTSKKTPKIKIKEDYSALPVFCNLYVPKSALNSYKSLYEKHDCLDCVDSFNTY